MDVTSESLSSPTSEGSDDVGLFAIALDEDGGTKMEVAVPRTFKLLHSHL